MLNTRKLTPKQNGAKKLQAQYGDRLLCVRYRYDRQLRKRYNPLHSERLLGANGLGSEGRRPVNVVFGILEHRGPATDQALLLALFYIDSDERAPYLLALPEAAGLLSF